MRLLLAALLLAACAAPPPLPEAKPVEAPESNPRIQVASSPVEPSRAVSEPLKPSLAALLACIRSYEGGYKSNTGNGFYGAYQFLQSTWDGVARRHAPRWVGVKPHKAPKQVQDQMAAWLIAEQGLKPWPTPNRKCR